MCNVACLQNVSTPVMRSVLDEVSDLEDKVECMVTHMHASRKGLEQRFQKLRPYIAKAREKDFEIQRASIMVSTTAKKEDDRQVRYLFKEGMDIGKFHWLVEMSSAGNELHISAYDAAHER